VAELSRPGGVAEQDAPPAETAQERVAPVRRLNIIGRRNIFFLISLLIIVPGIISMATQGFRLGIDFQGGAELFIKFDKDVTLAQVESAVGTNGSVQQTQNGQFVIRTGFLNSAQGAAFENDIAQKLDTTVDKNNTSLTVVGGVIAGETVRNALLAIVGASALILGYLTFRFRRVQGGWRAGFQFGGSALLALLHDVFLLTGVFSILGKVLNLRIGEIDSLFVTAVLTVVGFSVHDTIVVFDRIRENLIVSSRLTFEQVVNLSIMQTAARSLITSFTVVLVLASLLLFGGDTLKGFALALLVGIISGAYSSIFNAAPLLVVWRRLQPVSR
jgi:preprotein translocase subunit SecF